MIVTGLPDPCAIGDTGEKDMVGEAHAVISEYWPGPVASETVPLAASLAQTPKYTVPAAAPVVFQRYVGVAE